jgi:hypothetical protein
LSSIPVVLLTLPRAPTTALRPYVVISPSPLSLAAYLLQGSGIVLALTAFGLSTVRSVSFPVTELLTAEELFLVLVLVRAVVLFAPLLLMRSSLLMLTTELA